jgi:hypothetical protein
MTSYKLNIKFHFWALYLNKWHLCKTGKFYSFLVMYRLFNSKYKPGMFCNKITDRFGFTMCHVSVVFIQIYCLTNTQFLLDLFIPLHMSIFHSITFSSMFIYLTCIQKAIEVNLIYLFMYLCELSSHTTGTVRKWGNNRCINSIGMVYLGTVQGIHNNSVIHRLVSKHISLGSPLHIYLHTKRAR